MRLYYVKKRIFRVLRNRLKIGQKRYFDANNLQYLTKTEPMDSEIDDALKVEESKKGGRGGNYPDIKMFISLDSVKVPVVIECKGTKGDLVKLDDNGEPANKAK